MEWQRLSHLPIEQQTLANNQRQQAKLGSTIVLKVIAPQFSTQENLFKIQAATPVWLLAELGIPWPASLLVLAQFKPTIETIAGAVYLHSLIGDDLAKTDYVVLPTKISQALPTYMKNMPSPTLHLILNY